MLRPVTEAEITKTDEQPTSGGPPRRDGWGRWETIAFVAIVLFAAVIRLVHLSDPPSLVFDEVYYAKDACFYAGNEPSACEFEGTDEQTAVHPPLGKWLISAGVAAFGYDSFGYRIVPALAGALTVALMFLLARRLSRSLLVATLAALLLAIDPLHFVQSRVSMLDIFLPMFALAALLFLVIDRDRLIARAKSPPERDGKTGHGLLRRPWRIAAGAAAGAAVATKWSGGLVLLLVLLLAVAWETAARPEAGRLTAFGRSLRHEGPAIFLWLIVLPAMVYLVTYTGRLEGSVFAWPWTEGSFWNNLGARHHYMYYFHKDLEATHSYQSPAWSWMLLKRPVSYFFCSGADCNPSQPEGTYQEIFATGSPFVWWSSILAIGYLAWVWVRDRALTRPEGLVLAGFAVTYLPWMLIEAFGVSGRSAVFIFYLLPTVPFMVLAIALVAQQIGDSWEARAAISIFVIGAVGMFAFYYPLLTKRSLPVEQWRNRIWIFDNCDKPPAETVTETVTVTEGGEEKVTTSESTTGGDRPPSGWCWI